MSGRIAMAVMLMFTALGHFKFPAGMSMMLPEFVPYKLQIIYLTGVLEILGGIALLIHPLYKTDAWLLILFFISILPANIYAAIHHINLEKGDRSGSGMQYLLFRIPLQLFFIAWIWFFALYKG
ncbi:MAG: hypothetical protein PW786_08400 [Arachidicoccus sp.]|nr:hypothetical protein [Arachidicoccus sp.]